MGHPKVGASWEGFAIQQVIQRLNPSPRDCFFWALPTGAELDLLIVQGRRRRGLEVKLTDSPSVTRDSQNAPPKDKSGAPPCPEATERVDSGPSKDERR